MRSNVSVATVSAPSSKTPPPALVAPALLPVMVECVIFVPASLPTDATQPLPTPQALVYTPPPFPPAELLLMVLPSTETGAKV